MGLGLLDEEEEQHPYQRGNNGDEKKEIKGSEIRERLCHGIHKPENQKKADKRAKCSTGEIHAPVKAEGLSLSLRWGGFRDQCIPGRGPDALAHTVEETGEEDEVPAERGQKQQ